MADYDEVMSKLDYLDDTKQLIKVAIEEKGQDITDENAFREYVEKIMSISSGDVKLFGSVAEMNQYDKAKDGDLAIIYNTEWKNVSSGITFTGVSFSNILTISSLLEETRTFVAVDTLDSGNYNAYVTVEIPSSQLSVEDSKLYINIKNGNDNYSLLYKATDNTKLVFQVQEITYTNLDGTSIISIDESFDYEFGKALYIRDYVSVFNDLFKVKNVEYLGLYVYTSQNINKNKIYTFNNIRYDGALKADKLNWVDMQSANTKVMNSSPETSSFMGVTIVNNSTNHTLNSISVYKNIKKLLYYNNSLYVYGGQFTTREDAETWKAENDILKCNYNLDTMEYSEEALQLSVLEINGIENTYYYLVGEIINGFSVLYNWNYNLNIDNAKVDNIIVYTINLSNGDVSENILNGENATDSIYTLAPNQFTATDSSHLITGKVALGNNGVIVGDGSFTRNLTTAEFRDTFFPILPDTYPIVYDEVIQTGELKPYYTLVERFEKNCEDMESVDDKEALIVNYEVVENHYITDAIYEKIQNSDYSTKFFTKKNNVNYCILIGYDFSADRTTITKLYVLVIDLTNKNIYRRYENTSLDWFVFRTYRTYESEALSVKILSVGYDTDMSAIHTIVVPENLTSSENGPYIALLNVGIEADESAGISYNSWKIGKSSTEGTYVKVIEPKYDYTNRRFIMPIYSQNSDTEVLGVKRITIMDMNGNVSNLVSNENGIYNYNYLGSNTNFCGNENIYYYELVDSNNNRTYKFRKTFGEEIDAVPMVSGNISQRVFYNDYLYYVSSVQDENGYAIMRLKTDTMVLERYGSFISNDIYFIKIGNAPYIVYDKGIYSINNFDRKLYNYFGDTITNKIINDIRVDGIGYIDGYIQGETFKVELEEERIDLNQYKQVYYHYRALDSVPTNNDLLMIWPPIGDYDVIGSLYMYQSMLIARKNYDGTIAPNYYNKALRTSLTIEGRYY